MILHSRIGASSCERWWNCPGSVALCATLPKLPPSEYAEEGTTAHSLAEHCLTHDKDAFDAIHPDRPADMAEAVQLYLDTIREDMARYKCTKSDLQIEQKFHLADVDPDAFGTNDACLNVFGQKLIVYDYKHGKGIAVDAEENKQVMFYGVGAAAQPEFELIDEVELVIVQPRAVHKDGPVRRWTLTKDELMAFRSELKGAITRTKQMDAPLITGGWCKKSFCPAMAVCPAVLHKVENEAQLAFSQGQTLDPVKPEAMSPIELQRALDAIPLIDAWANAVKGYAHQLATQGEKVSGYKLVQKKSSRKWKDETLVVKQFGKKAVRVIEEVISPAQLETELKKEMKKAEAVKLVEPFTFKPDTGTVLVPENDPREAVSASALEFKDETTDEIV